MKSRTLLLILIVLTSVWACVEEPDDPEPKVPDQEVPIFAKRYGG